ncbi:MAG: alpha/beta hydrolase, partial [Pirellulaceae bacterium]|nr:alpha/beta hydrolase [Pirellulaceae bacterium]
MNEVRLAVLISTTCLVAGLVAPALQADEAIGLPDVRRSYVAFEAFGVTESWPVAGELRIPQSEQDKFPAVIIVHGSNGVDTRGEYHAMSLNEKGIITLEIDMWAARKNFSGAGQRPKGVPETLPDAYGALIYLASLPFVDAQRIGIMGFSWGGVVTMLTATKPYNDK